MSRRFKVVALAAAAATAAGLTMAAPAATAGQARIGRITTKKVHLDWAGHRSAAETAALKAQAAGGTPIRDFSRTINDGGTNFTYTMIGRDPFVAQSRPTTKIRTYLQPVRIQFSNGDFWDPTVADSCDAGASALARTQNSPIFVAQTWNFGGTSVGKAQYVDAVQRAGFYDQTKPTGINPNYHVKLALVTLPKLVINVPANKSAEGSMSCATGKFGAIEINYWDSLVQNTLLPNMAAQGLTLKDFPLFLFGNVVMFDTVSSNCCILGYHFAKAPARRSRATATRCTTTPPSSPARATPRCSPTRSPSGSTTRTA